MSDRVKNKPNGYRVFIDDSGSRDYRNPYAYEFAETPPGNEYQQFWRDNYFVLCGVRIRENDLGPANTAINDLKRRAFGTNQVEIKSDWLRNPHQRRKYYLRPFGISEEKLKSFVDELYRLLKANRQILKLMAAVFDKRFYGPLKRGTAEGTPLLKCVQVLFERLQYLQDRHLVVFDQFESELKVSRSHQRITEIAQGKVPWQRVYVASFSAVDDIRFVRSSSENFIQVADLCAYNIFRQFVRYGREWHNREGAGKLPLYEYFDRIRCNFHSDPATGKVPGYGLICLPDVGKCPWNLLEGCE